MSVTTTWQEYKDKGAEAYKKGDAQTAIELWSKAIVTGNKNEAHKEQLHVLYSNRSAAFMTLGRPADALYDANKTIEVSPTFLKGYHRAGVALYKLGRFQEAIKIYERGLEIDANNADLKKALADARKAAEENKPLSYTEMKPKLQEFVSRNLLASRLFFPRIFMILNAVLYLIPFVFSRNFTFWCYKRVLISALCQYAYILYFNHGLPKLNMEYFAKVMQDSTMPYLFLAMLLFPTKPYPTAIGPIVLTESIHLLWYVSEILQLAQPSLAKALSASLVSLTSKYTQDAKYGTLGPKEKWVKIYKKTNEYSIYMELSTGLLMIVELVTPWRALGGTFLYWNYLKLRYMLDRDGIVKQKFKDLDEKLLSYTSHPKCSPIIGKGYAMLRAYCAKQVEVPDPQTAQQGGGGLGSRCSIM